MNTLKTLTEKCCPFCFCASHDTFIGGIEQAVPDSCKDEDCECHIPPPVAIEKNFLDVSCPKCGHIPNVSKLKCDCTPPSSNAQWEKELDQLILAHIAIQSGFHAGNNTIGDVDEAGTRIKTLFKSTLLTQKKELLQRIYDSLPDNEQRKLMALGWGNEGTDRFDGYISGAKDIASLVCYEIFSTPDCGVNMETTHAQQLIRDND